MSLFLLICIHPDLQFFLAFEVVFKTSWQHGVKFVSIHGEYAISHGQLGTTHKKGGNALLEQK
jgi:hypothetical protein